MDIIHSDTYNNLFHQSHNSLNKIQIFVGYASHNMLETLIEDFPRVQIDLIIGMALDGISIEDHTKYLDITKNKKNVRVYYRINDKKSHIKLYKINDDITYVGSANFSSVALYDKQQELLIKTSENFDGILADAYEKSKLCYAEESLQKIPFYVANSDQMNSKNNEEEKYKDQIIQQGNKLNQFNSLIQRIDYNCVKELFIVPVLPPQSDTRWNFEGINTNSKFEQPYLMATSVKEFRRFFIQKKFTLFVENDGLYESFEAYLGGDFDKKLCFENSFNIYNYIKNYTNIIKERPISYEDLLKNNIKSLKITRLNEAEYFLEVIKIKES